MRPGQGVRDDERRTFTGPRRPYDEAANIIAINPQFLAADQLALRQANLAGALIAAG
ncbi:hypothetical protein NKJ84_30425 [Mesorhizobium sp. M0048]|uniref:hypothetical protein n=1 Tax=Mesorhizobium sp. M0048 TaxID=2956860 RepID=UPI003335501F